MNVSLSSIRTALHELEAAVESGLQPSKEHPPEGHDASSAVRAAGSDQKPVNFASPSDPASSTAAHPARTTSVEPASASDQGDPLKQFMDVIMKAIMQFLQSLQHKDEGGGKAHSLVSAGHIGAVGCRAFARFKHLGYAAQGVSHGSVLLDKWRADL